MICDKTIIQQIFFKKNTLGELILLKMFCTVNYLSFYSFIFTIKIYSF